ncbi:MAG: class A beta-lactamase-related serine hydrolase [Opitutae bacterium]|nr:class A beta-lactamase-related serine hydrolase [Opitutae bacterium]
MCSSSRRAGPAASRRWRWRWSTSCSRWSIPCSGAFCSCCADRRRARRSRAMGASHWTAVAALALACWGAAGGLGRCFRDGPTVPGKHWETKAPEKAGFSGARLAEFSERAGGSGCVVHGGRIIHAWGDPAARNDAASSTKPMYAHLLFKAIESGRLGSLDERAATWLPALGELNAELGHKDRQITLRHLLGQTSGYGLAEKPGEAFAYNDFGTGLLSWILFCGIYGLAAEEYDGWLNGAALGGAIGFEDWLTAPHQRSRPRRFRVSVRDQARFVLLYLRGGRWGHRQVLREDLVAEQLAFHLPAELPRTSGREAERVETIKSFGGGADLKNHLGCLGYYWWFNRVTPDGGRLLPDAPPGTFMGSGYGGRFAMIAIPERDLVVVWQDIHRGEDWTPLSEVGRFRVNEVIRELLQAQIRATR